MPKILLYFSLLVSLLSTLGSLFFSEILHFTPCILCWYQRISMYPLVIIFAIGILRKDKQVYMYALPLAIIGLLTAFYQNLLTWGIIPEAISPCNNTGVSCTTKYVELFGFITIPFLSMVSFLIIVVLMWMLMKRSKNHES